MRAGGGARLAAVDEGLQVGALGLFLLERDLLLAQVLARWRSKWCSRRCTGGRSPVEVQGVCVAGRRELAVVRNDEQSSGVI